MSGQLMVLVVYLSELDEEESHMNNKLFKGIMPAMITPFDADGKLKEASARKLMEYELGYGIQGFYVNGATGEGLFLSEDTRKQMIEVAVDVCKGKAQVINHVGAVDVNSAIRLAKHAGEVGCDAISSLVPNYVANYSTEQVLDYYKRISDASGLPVLVYCTGLLKDSPYDFMQKAINTGNIIGLKYTMPNYYNMQQITLINSGDINVINGPDESLICGLTMGADGGIGSTYNLMGAWYVELYNAFTAGKFEKARQLQFKINKVITVLLKHDCIPAIKEALNVMGFDVGNIAYPGKVFTAEQRAAFIADMNEAGFPL